MGQSSSRPVANGQGDTSEVQLPQMDMKIAPGRNDNDWSTDTPYTGPAGGAYGYQGIPTGGMPTTANGLPIDALGRVTVTVGENGGVLSALGGADIDQRAGYGQLVRTGQLTSFDAKGSLGRLLRSIQTV